jgi:PPK2 family polyphosphate:nucleotide phosphotransferase
MAKKSELDDFRVPFHDQKAAESFRLDVFDPADKPFALGSKDKNQQRLDELGARLDRLQECLNTQASKRVLLVLQGMDTSGKDGTVRAVFRDVSPLGVRIAAFKAPTPVERAHDFLWRIHQQAPAAGELVVFNRSHYEDVLVPRVLGQIDAKECERRYQEIRQFETHLAESGATIIKCFLTISKDEQRKRLQERIDNPEKHWKFDVSDIEARRYWDDYQLAYRDALAATSAKHAPWYVIPANSKTHRNLMIAELLLHTLDAMDLHFPPPKPELTGMIVK